MDEIRVGVVGYGLAGSVFHAPLVDAEPGMRVVSVVTSHDQRQRQARSAYPAARVFGHVDELWRRASSHDLIVLATPTETHLPLGEAALELDLPLVVDKPFAVDVAGATALLEAAETRGVPLTVFQNRRWDSDQRTLSRLLADGALGDVVRFESRFERWRPVLQQDRWRDTLPPGRGGGTLLDLGSHLVDQALQLFGPAELAFADARRVRGGVADDEAFLVLRHESGTRSHLSMGMLFGAYGPRMRVSGTEAALVVTGVDSQEQQLRAGLRPGDEGYGAETSEDRVRLLRGDQAETVAPEPGAWPEFYAGVARALADGAPMPVDPCEALETQRLLDAARAYGRASATSP
ncbi:MAG: Gfo/Idh/MocA family oxidoreductase [Streptosporangiales bacterium]